MRVVKIMGGLGNQLFLYGYYREIKKLYKECYVDKTWFETKRETWYPYQLGDLGLEADFLEKNKYIVREYYMKNHKLKIDEFEKIKSMLTLPILHMYKNTTPYAYDELWKNDNAYYFGVFQNINNMKDVLDDIVEEVRFPKRTDEIFLKYKKKILEDNNSVAVHIRLDDYAAIEDFEKLCPIDYYIAGMKYIMARKPDAHFYIFSNRIQDAKARLPRLGECVFVDINDRHNGMGDMELMTLCRNVIFPNSTFGWWSAVLNKNKNKIVVAPDNFDIRFPEVKRDDINLWFKHWTRIKSDGILA